MSQVAPTQLKPVSIFGEVMVKGRIESMRLHDGMTYTRLMSPAKDEFSSPQQYEVRSEQPLGQPKQIVDIKCELHGWPGKRFSYIDRNTGQQMQGQNMNMALNAIF